MVKRYVLVSLLVVFCAALLCQPASAKEDTAQIRLKKIALPSKKLYIYTMKKGVVLSSVLKTIPGITEENLSDNYKFTKELNPDISDFSNLEPGQSLILPGKPFTGTRGNEEGYKNTLVSSRGVKYYKIKRGDTLSKIIHRQLKNETNVRRILRAIKAINPTIKNINRIYAGTVIKLPVKAVFVKSPDVIRTPAPEFSEKTYQPAKIIEIKKYMPPEARLAVLKQVITQMNGSITTTGNYYLPIPKAGQVTIDCSKIPLIEFDDNTIVFLDLNNRAPYNLKKMIDDNWTNYFLVKAEKSDDVIAILRKVINSSSKYRMMKSEKPLLTGVAPPVEVTVDWIIVRSLPQQQPRTIQGLRSIAENNVLLPRSIKNYFQKNGVSITEISDETGITGKPEEVYSLPPIQTFPTTSVKEFAYALVSYIGFNAEKDVDIQVFDTAKDGFNLAIKADVLVKKGGKKYIIHSQNLSQQFVSALKQAGNETIFVGDNDSLKNVMENILRGFNIPFTSGDFTFSGLSRNQAPYTIKFNGTKIKTNQDVYIIDFDIDQGLRGLLQEIWSANIARY